MKYLINITVVLSVLFVAGCNEDDTYLYVDGATLELTPEVSIFFGHEGGTTTVVVETNQEDWGFEKDQDWLSVKREGNTLLLEAPENPAAGARPTATITISAGPSYNHVSEDLRVDQGGQEEAYVILTPDPQTVAVPYTGGNMNYSVQTNQSYWKAESDLPWVDVRQDSDGFTIVITENTSADPRETATVTVFAGTEDNNAVKTFTVDQEGVPNITGTNLSAGGTANCYVVSSAGSYFFNATIMGNNSTHGGYAPQSLSPASAELLWQDYFESGEGLVRELELEENYISFSTFQTFHPGNAVIAVRDEHGVIIWSWHLWFVDDLKDQNIQDATNNNNLLYAIHDRNLGAVSAAPGNYKAYGLMYQWGRKDPFPGASGKGLDTRTQETDPFLGTSAANTSGTHFCYDINGNVLNSSSKMIWQEAETAENVRMAVNNPTTFYLRQTATENDWLLTRDDNLWGNPWVESVTYPAYNSAPMNSDIGAKTIYDPCPSGYRVMPMDVWVKSGTVRGRNTTYDSENWGYKLSIVVGGGEVWIPMAGYRVEYNGAFASAGSAGFIWMSSPSQPPTADGSKNGATISSSSTVWNNMAINGGPRGRGYPVRCSKE